MKAVGIICEYNPFHSGHRHQIEQARLLSGCDAVVCVMSGSFVQRGEVAMFDKWTRTRYALKNGADLVIELPAYYVLQSAKEFAYGGINILAKSHLVDSISFGSESADVNGLINCAKILSEKNEEIKSALEKLMDNGLSYPFALRNAMESLYPTYSRFLDNPNDMLGVSYISSMIKLGESFDIYPVKRFGADHHCEDTDGITASSTAIRKAIENGEDVSRLSPCNAEDATYSSQKLEPFILGFFRTASPEKLKSIPSIEDGFENRLISCSHKAKSLEEFYDMLTSRRYTKSRVKRTVMAGIIGLENGVECDYVRILGFNDKGAELLKSKKDKTELPFVTKTAYFVPSDKSTFKYDILATDIAALCCDNDAFRIGGKDFYNSPVKL